MGRIFDYSRDEQLTVWSLTLPQVAATLAATLVAHDTLRAAGQRLLDDRMLNVVLVLVLVTGDPWSSADEAIRPPACGACV